MENYLFQSSKGYNLTGSYHIFPTNDEYRFRNFLDIILVHAFPFDSRMYLPNIEDEYVKEKLNRFAIQKGNIRIFLPNLPGFGNSDILKEKPTNLLPYTQCIEEVVKKFNIENLIIGGCSMGGYIALEFIHNNTDTLKGLILIDTKATADTDEQKQNRFQTIENIQKALKTNSIEDNDTIVIEQLSNQDQNIKAFINNLSNNIVSEYVHDKYPTISKEIRKIMKQQKLVGVIHALRAMAGRRDNTKILKKFKKKVLIIVGEYDQITPIEISKQMKNIASKAKLKVVSNAGHLSNMENSYNFNLFLMDWIKKI
ncbi:MAG: alpha/beta hydrolase [Promethearchaeota archaeon]|nr:MAG: alpha/beta hydrolase [Candidatus Lokiarchaeota archaeon]